MGNGFKRFELATSITICLIILLFITNAISDMSLDSNTKDEVDISPNNEIEKDLSDAGNDEVEEDIITIKDEPNIQSSNSDESEKVGVIIDSEILNVLNDELNDTNFNESNISLSKEIGQINLYLNNINMNLSLKYGEMLNAYASTPWGEVILLRNGEAISNDNISIKLPVGYYNYTAISMGDENHSSAIVSYFVNVTKGDPTINMVINGSTSLIYGTLSDYIGNEMNNGDGDCRYTLTNNSIFRAGTYIFNYSTEGCSNYTFGSISKTLLVTRYSPSLFIGVTPGINVSNLNSTTVTGFGCPNQLSCILTRDGVAKSNPENTILNVGQYNYTFYTLGNENYSSYSVSQNVYVYLNNFSYIDNEKPEIVLIAPSNEVDLETKIVEFTFNAKDNIKLKNCTFSLYYYNHSANIGSLIYHETKNSLTNDKNETISLKDFESGDYSWDIGCYDNSSNYNEKGRDFSYFKSLVNVSVQKTNQTVMTHENSVYENDVDKLITQINDFLIKEEKYEQDEINAINTLGLIDNLRFYKKKLLQIQSDLEHNLGYISDVSKREERYNQIKKDMEEIKKNIPDEIDVIAKKSFTKNTIDADIGGILKLYNQNNNILMSDDGINQVANVIRDKQSNLVVESEIKEVEIKYVTLKVDKIILISKKINLKETNDFTSILEYVPDDFEHEEIIFINKYDAIKNGSLYEVKLDDLNNEKVIYYIKEGNYDDIEKMDTLVFGDKMLTSRMVKSGITGFSVVFTSLNKGISFYISWVLVLLAMVLLVVWYYRKKNQIKYKKDANYKKIIELLTSSKDFLDNKETEIAKQKYYEIKEFYSKLNNEMRRMVYPKLVKMQKEIDKSEVSLLINECIKAINEKRKDDALIVYEQIKPIYSRLPSNYREKIYNKIIPFLK